MSFTHNCYFIVNYFLNLLQDNSQTFSVKFSFAAVVIGTPKWTANDDDMSADNTIIFNYPYLWIIHVSFPITTLDS